MNEAETVEAVFTQARDAEASAEGYLGDVGWKSVEGRRQRPRSSGNGLGAAVRVPVQPAGRRAFADMPPEDFARLVASIREDGLNCCGARLALNDKGWSGAWSILTLRPNMEPSSA